MSDITNGYDLNGSRRRHVGEENHYDKRMRERQEAKQAEKKEHATHAAAQQIQAQQWREWFRTCFYHEPDGDEGLYAAIGEGLADMKREAYEKARAEYAPKITALEDQIRQFKQMLAEKTAVDAQVEEITKRLDARALARDEAKCGPIGRQGERGARGERGPAGARGPAGRPAERGRRIVAWKIDYKRYRAVPLIDDNSFGPSLELRKLFEQFFLEMGYAG